MVTRLDDEDLDRSFRTLLESVPGQGVLLLESDGRIARWNAGAERLFGWSEAEVVGRPGHILFTPEDRAARAPELELAKAAHDGFASDDRWHLRKDGARIHVAGSMNAVRDAGGELRGFIKLVREDTDRVLALERLELAQAAAGVGTFEWRIPEDRLVWTRELDAIYGFAPGAFNGGYDAWRRLVHPDDLTEVEQRLQAALADGGRYEGEYRIVRADGSERWIVSRGLCHFDGRGRPLRMVGVSIDITARKQALDAAEQGRRTLRTLLDQAPVGIAIADGGLDFRIIHLSAFACRLIGRDCADLGIARVEDHAAAWGLRHADGSPIADPSRLPLTRAVRGGEIVANEEWLIERADGSVVPVLCNSGPVRDAAGTITGGILAFVDIGERRRVEEHLRAANQELEQFAYIASHDLQEPLRMIASYLGLLRRKYSGNLDANANEYIHLAVDGAERMQKLIRQLLDFARLERAAPQLVDIDSGEALADALAVLAERVAESGATVEPAQLPRLRADRDLLARLFQNLVGNAIKYSAKGRAPQVRISATRGDHAWLFSVRDNGIGIAAEDRERIFAVFQRLHTRDEYPGSGIGLAICKRIVDRHGGRIWVESPPGGGSAFCFTIPDRPPAAAGDL